MGKCKNCKYWDGIGRYQGEFTFWDCSLIPASFNPEVPATSSEGQLATLPSFGCNSFEAEELEQTDSAIRVENFSVVMAHAEKVGSDRPGLVFLLANMTDAELIKFKDEYLSKTKPDE